MEERVFSIENCAELDLRNRAFFNTDYKIKKYSYEKFKWDMNIFCHTIFRIAFVIYGFLQFFVTHAAFVKILHQDNIFIQLVSLILGFFPFIGTFLGVYCAQVAWGWDLPYSIIIFISPYFIAHGPLLLIAFVDIYKDSHRG